MSKRITELNLLTTANHADLVPVVDMTSGIPTTKKIAIRTLLDTMAGAECINVGGEAEVFKEKNITTLSLRTIKAGHGMVITQNDDDIEIGVIDTDGEVLTSDATPTFAILATLAENDVKQIDVIAKVTSADASVRQVFRLSALYYGAAGPVATIDGSVATTDTGTGTAVITLDTSGATVRLSVTGIAATDLTTTYDTSII